MSKHTPSPWHVAFFADANKGYTTIRGPTSLEHICDIFPFGNRAKGQPRLEHDANARLIAAAPKLMEEAQTLLSEIREHGTHQCWKGLAAAVDKAEEETQ